MTVRQAILLTALSAAAVSCSDDEETAAGDLSGINLTVNSENRYLYIVTEDSAGISKETYRDTFATRVEAVGQTVGQHTDLILVRSYDVGADSMYTQTWYRQTQQELTDEAYRQAGRTPVVMPKRDGKEIGMMKNSAAFGLHVLSGHFAPTGDTTIRTDSRIVYQYPLFTGRSWISFSNPFQQSRSVSGKQNLTVPAGTFSCTIIRTALPSFSPTMEWIDFVSEKGLIVRTISDSMMVSTEESPEGTGVMKKFTFDLRLMQRNP